MAEDIWWRCEAYAQAHWDDWAETVTHYTYHVRWRRFVVTKTTPKGVWVREVPGFQPTFVLGTAKRQLCVPTRELAQKDEIARRKRHVSGAKARLHIAARLLRQAELHTWKAPV